MRWWILILAGVVGCDGGGHGPRPSTKSSESDADTDADSDADTDSDADVDTADSGSYASDPETGDTGLLDPGLVTGEWIGSCTSRDVTYIRSMDLDLHLVESAGTVNGKGGIRISEVPGTGSGGSTYTFTVPLVVRGTFDGTSELEIDLAQDYGGSVEPLDIAVYGPVSGNVWTATLGSSVYTSSYYATYDCVLERQ